MKTHLSSAINSGFRSIRKGLDEKLFTSVDLTTECLRRLNAVQSRLNTTLQILETNALYEAQAADIRLNNGEHSPLLGIPIGIKDNILTKGSRTTAASKFLENFESPTDATVIAKLREAGSPIVAKMNMDEFGMGSSNENSAFGAVKNPWNLNFVSGGSSGGSAAAVAARCLPLTLGTDTGGSIRQPASFCGITGIKPTYGKVSRLGVLAYASSLDQVGPFSVDVSGLAASLDILCGWDPLDPTSEKSTATNFLKNLQMREDIGNLSGLKIGIPEFLFLSQGIDKQVSAKVRHSLETFKNLGAQLVSVDLPHLKYSVSAYYIVATSEASSNLSRYNGIHCGKTHLAHNIQAQNIESMMASSRSFGFGNEVKSRILLGTFALSSGFFEAYYQKASQVRALIKKDFESAFDSCDVIVTPTSPIPVFGLGEKQSDPLAMYYADLCTLGVNLAGLPAMSLNCGFDDLKLPVGLQIIPPWNQESRALEMARLFELENPQLQTLPELVKDLL
jgi:aspartyl-tRNA(Asn)/glutamyl-tRNA(Gln) amidotransferase subunit A